MFGGFNQTPYNRSLTVEIYGTFEIDALCDVLMVANIVTSAQFAVESENEVIFDSIRERLAQFVIDATNEMEFEVTRERRMQFEIQGELEIDFNGARNHVDYIEFEGEFKPGDQIVLDSSMLKMTLNGKNALHLMQGDFFDLNTGNNELIYTDDKTGRTVRMRITYNDKFV